MDLNQSITYHITKCGVLLRQLTAKRIKQAGIDLTPEEAILLNQLWDQDRQTLSQLSQWSLKGPSTITRQIDSLQRKGYVQRQHSESDRRHIYVQLTEQGRQLQTPFHQHTDVPGLDEVLCQLPAAQQQALLQALLDIKSKALNELER